jgi:acyl-CoA oxidase
MMVIRESLIMGAAKIMCMASMVAIRYSYIRTQFEEKKGIERPIIDYLLQKQKIYPLLAKSYCAFFNGAHVQKMIIQNNEQVANNDFSLMKEIHILLCIMKGLYTQWGNDGNFNMMQACGGHGYLKSSGFASMIDKGFAGVILEGENTVLMLQIATEIEKTYSTVKKTGSADKVLENLKYFPEVIKFDEFCAQKFQGQKS